MGAAVCRLGLACGSVLMRRVWLVVIAVLLVVEDGRDRDVVLANWRGRWRNSRDGRVRDMVGREAVG